MNPFHLLPSHKMVTYAIFFSLLISPLLSAGQTKKDSTDFPFTIGARGQYGFIYAHRQGMRHLVEGHVPSYEVYFERPTFGNKEWQSLYNFPEWGVAFLYVNYNNPEMIGNGYSIYPYLNFHLAGNQRSELNFKTGLGFGIIEEPFHRLENYKNTAIGSYGNLTVTFMLSGRWHLSDKIFVEPGLSISHFSNTAIKTPNLGINTPFASLSLGYHVGDHQKEKKLKEPTPLDKEIKLGIYSGAGVKEIYPTGGRKYPAYSLMFEGYRALNHKNELGLGTDVVYNSSFIEQVDDSTATRIVNLTNGVKLGYKLTIQQLSLLFQAGYYTFNKNNNVPDFYHRFGIRYEFKNRFIFNGTLKTHFAKADHLEIGIGYRIR